jgi:very-short-patch-repair endonuclease
VLLLAGITVIRITWRQLEREPEAVLVEVAQALARTAR